MLVYKQTNLYTDNSAQEMEYEIVPFETPSFDEPTPTPTSKSDFQKVGPTSATTLKNTAGTQHPSDYQFHAIQENFTSLTESSFTEVSSTESIVPSLELAVSEDSVSDQDTFGDKNDENDTSDNTHSRSTDTQNRNTVAPEMKSASENKQTQEGSLQTIADLFHSTMFKTQQTDETQQAIANLFYATMNQTKLLVHAAASTTDETASLSLDTTCDDWTQRTALTTAVDRDNMKEQPPTARHSNKSNKSTNSSFQYDDQSIGGTSMSNMSYSNLGEEGVYASRVSRLHAYGTAQIQIRREIQFIDRLENNKRELMFNLRLREKKKKQRSEAPPLPPLEQRGRRIHDTYATKKNDAGKKLRELIEKRNAARATLRKMDWK